MLHHTLSSPKLRQSFTALGPILITISLGMTEGYSATLLPQLDVSPDLASWIASMAALPMALGCILGGIFMEKIGRKSTHILACFPCTLGWLVLYFSTNTPMLLVGRFITGLSVGLLGPPTGVYLSETSSPHLRGFLLASISSAIALGLFLVHLSGTFLTWQDTCLVCCAFPALCVACMVFAPESPTWLVKQNRISEGSAAFRWCRGESPETELELSILIERQAELNTTSGNTRNILEVMLSELNKPEFYKPLAIIVVFFIACQWSGLNAITFYSISILRETLRGDFDEYAAMLVIDAVRVLASILACILLKKIGRRHLALVSGTGTCLSLLVLSLYTFLCKNKSGEDLLAIIPLVALVGYVLFITVGFVPLPWTLMGEMFPQGGRGVGSGISALAAYVSFFSVVKTQPEMFLYLGADATFLVYATVAFVGTLVLGVFLPETKDKALYEIEDCFKK